MLITTPSNLSNLISVTLLTHYFHFDFLFIIIYIILTPIVLPTRSCSVQCTLQYNS